MKALLITEKQFDNVFGIYLISFSNPLTLYMNKSKSLNEGIFKTYPPDKVQNYISKMFKLPKNWIEYGKSEQDGVYFFRVQISKSNELMDKIIRAMALCGYFCSFKDTETYKTRAFLQFEPRHQNNANEEVRSMKYIYHVSPSYNKGKILKNGFTPTTKNALFDYPDRVYFFKQNTTEDDLLELTAYLCKYNKSLGNDNIYTIFVLDVSKIPEQVNFYLDGNYFNGIYSQDNIPPSAIVYTDDFNVNPDVIDETINTIIHKEPVFNIYGYSNEKNIQGK
jgi:hypothetical protein